MPTENTSNSNYNAPPNNANSAYNSNITHSSTAAVAGDQQQPQQPIPLIPPPSTANNILAKDPVVIKPAQDKPKQSKKDKGPTKEEIVKKAITFVREWLAVPAESDTSADAVLAAFLELKIADKFMRDAVSAILNEIIDKGDPVFDRVVEFLASVKKDGKLQNNAILDSFKALINGMNDSPVSRITTLVASLLCRSVVAKLCKLSDVANNTENGAHYPLFLLVLQQMHKTLGKQALLETFNTSKVNLMTSLPEADRTKDRMAEILDDRNLSFLYPLLKLQGELQKQIQVDPNPQTLYKWIKDNVESVCYTDPGFITALVNVILKFVTQVRMCAKRHSSDGCRGRGLTPVLKAFCFRFSLSFCSIPNRRLQLLKASIHLCYQANR